MYPINPEIYSNGRTNGVDRPRFLRAGICDLDGPLIKTPPAEYEATRYILRNHGVTNFNGRDFFEVNGKGEMFTELALKYGLEINPRELRTLILNRADQIMGYQIPLATGALNFLERSQLRDVQIAIATSNQRVKMFEKLDRAGIDRFPSAHAAGDEVKSGKPDPEIYELAIWRLGVKPKNCFAVGDTLQDYEAARKAGIEAFYLTNNSIHPFSKESVPEDAILVDHIGYVLPSLDYRARQNVVYY